MLKIKEKLTNDTIKLIIGICLCFISVLGLINYTYPSVIISYAICFLFGNLYFIFFIFLFLIGLSLIIFKKIKKLKWNFLLTGSVILFITISMIFSLYSQGTYLDNGNLVSYNGKELTVFNFNTIFLNNNSINIKFSSNGINAFSPSIGGGYFGYLLVAIFNSIFTSYIGTIVFISIFFILSLFFILYRPIISLIKHIKFLSKLEKQKKESRQPINDENFEEINDEGDKSATVENNTFNEESNLVNNIDIQTATYNEKSITRNKYDDVSVALFPNDINQKEIINTLNSNKSETHFAQENYTNDKSESYQNNDYKNDDKYSNNESNYLNSIESEKKQDVNETELILEDDIDTNLINNSNDNNNEIDNYSFNNEEIQNKSLDDISNNEIENINNTNNIIFQTKEETIINKQNNIQTNEISVENVSKNIEDNPYKNFKPLKSEPFLKNHENQSNKEANIALAEETIIKINEKFVQLGIKAKAVSYTIGPAVTRYDILPDANTSISSLEKYTPDISMSLSGKRIRFEKVVLGKTTGSYEIANNQISTVGFKQIFEEMPEVNVNKLIIPFGKDISGNYITANLAKLPHLLVCGQTGSGKSVLMHSFIISLMMRHSPNNVRFIFIDPKRVEFGKYKECPHLLCPPILDMKEVKPTLDKLIEEMENRFILLEEACVSNITEYNDYVRQENRETLPFIVLIVDEFADLIETDKTISSDVIRLASKARACGIHMIIATQRPSADVFNGLIKSNIPGRVALSVKDSVNSKIILDETGAETLLGNGDMLISSMEISKNGLVRVQGSYIDNSEIREVITYLKNNYPVRYDENYLNLLQKAQQEAMKNETNSQAYKENEIDSLYESVKQFAFSRDYVSINAVQRQFSVGFTRAGKLHNYLIKDGIIEQFSSSTTKGHKVLIKSQAELDDIKSGETI